MSCTNLMGIATMVFGLSASASLADDFADAAPADDWSGFYAGLHAGWGWADSDMNFDAASDFSGTVVENGFSSNLDGPLAGAQLGYNWPVNSFLLGFEADASWSGLEGSYRRIEIGGGYYFNADSDVDWLASLRARAGLIWESTLLYGTGGIAFAGSNTDVTSDYSGVDVSISDSITHTGWVLGAGFETKISSNMTARLEYLHYDFGGADIFYRLDPLSDAYDAFGDAELDVDVIRLAVNFLF